MEERNQGMFQVGGAELSLQTENGLINPKKYLLILLLLWIPK